VACRLFYRESERFPHPDPRLESADDSQRVHAFVFGKVCPPPDQDYPTNDPLAKARFWFETAFAVGGVSSLAGINGNWAAVVCSNSDGTVVLATDPFGIQKIYYTRLNSAVCFATHLPALGNIDVCCQVDRTGIAQFLHFLYVPSPRTALEGVSCVPIGKAVMVTRQGAEVRSLHSRIPDPFWRERCDGGTKRDSHEPLSHFDDILTSAVLERSAPIGRTAIFLSGGKDSSSLCIAASKIDPHRYLAVTVGFDDESVDESSDAALVAQHLGMDHIVLKFTVDDYVGALEDFLRAHGQPFGDPAGLPAYLAAKSLPPECEAILDGTGSDSYMGVPVTWFDEVYLTLPIVRYFALLLTRCVSDNVQGRVGGLIRRLGKPLREFSVSWDGWSEREIRRLFKMDARLTETELSRLVKLQAAAARHPVEFKTKVMCRIWEPDTVYRKTVQAANYLGLPVGFPLADTRLAGLFATLPDDLRLSRRTNKVLLRAHLSRYLPKRIVEKPKGSFVFSRDVLLRANKHGVLRKYLCDDASVRSGTMRTWQTSAAVRRYVRGDSTMNDRIYALLLLSVWLGQHSRKATRE
jgi:asparagine synthase (glutamine-hydrolysing)